MHRVAGWHTVLMEMIGDKELMEMTGDTALTGMIADKTSMEMIAGRTQKVRSNTSIHYK